MIPPKHGGCFEHGHDSIAVNNFIFMILVNIVIASGNWLGGAILLNLGIHKRIIIFFLIFFQQFYLEDAHD